VAPPNENSTRKGVVSILSILRESNSKFVYGKEKPCRLGEISLFENATHFLCFRISLVTGWRLQKKSPSSDGLFVFSLCLGREAALKNAAGSAAARLRRAKRKHAEDSLSLLRSNKL